MNSIRPESHVAQQSRRDKLRVQHLEDFPNNMEQLSEPHPDLLQVRNVRNANMLYEAAFVTPEPTVNFTTRLNHLTARRDSMESQEYASFSNSSAPTTTTNSVQPYPKDNCEPHSSGNWKNFSSRQGCDWMMNYASGSVGNESNPNSYYVAEVNDVSSYQQYVKPAYNGLQEVQPNLNNRSGEISIHENQKQLGGMHLPSLPVYHNTLQEVVKSASLRTQGSEMASIVHHNIKEASRGSWAGGGNQSNQLHFDIADSWKDRSVHNFPQWSGALGFIAKRSDEESRPLLTDLNPQGLSLSLSSNPDSKLPLTQFGEGSGSDNKLQSRTGDCEDHRYLKSVKSGYLCQTQKPSIITKGSAKSLQEIVGMSQNFSYQNVGPLGPFTGYATILKSSKFLKPAQQLLDEFCIGPKLVKEYDMSERVSGEVCTSTSAAANAIGNEVVLKCNNSGASSSTFYSSNENIGDGGVGSSCESFQPECQQKKAKLLYMQDEVSRRHKQYHQQMQMVVSSFESVAGLSFATPYISLALKSVSRHFKCLKNAIFEQLKYIEKVLGEDLSAPTTGMSSTKDDTTMTRLRNTDKCFHSHNSGGGTVGFLEPQQHVWRPQRGLPERSVAILKAWLFEHFLHPYPTDTDKHMLATQTGLSRNQVSNWFINARVRVWKPMVEEIHMLETKGLACTNQNSSKNDGSSATEGTSQPRVDQPPYRFGMHATPDKQLECLEMGSLVGTENGHGDLHSEPLECQMTPSMDRSLMGFLPYQRGGLGSVSLTLGLRNGVENAQHQQQQLQQEDQLRRHFGGHMIHDFVG
ncbi:putative BEL1-like homeodomain 8 [Quillaja saponaria]|uniref:BEL1-like homeodomain 8 n=1 Tax=Quillaja saponaria TaxID=32244 RepID=A0AAD7VMF2_QUISA|nr:putative BEL1-like homeodomain 8 [Quillaja saponaria]